MTPCIAEANRIWDSLKPGKGIMFNANESYAILEVYSPDLANPFSADSIKVRHLVSQIDMKLNWERVYTAIVRSEPIRILDNIVIGMINAEPKQGWGRIGS